MNYKRVLKAVTAGCNYQPTHYQQKGVDKIPNIWYNRIIERGYKNMITLERKPENIGIYEINARGALIKAHSLRKPVTIYTRTRTFLDNFTCIDKPNKPVTLERFELQMGLIYYKVNNFEWRTISLDDVIKIEIA